MQFDQPNRREFIHGSAAAPMRAALGGGEAIICSNVKIGGPGTTVDIPLAHKGNVWSIDHLDTPTVARCAAAGRDRCSIHHCGWRTATPAGFERDASDDFWSEA